MQHEPEWEPCYALMVHCKKCGQLYSNGFPGNNCKGKKEKKVASKFAGSPVTDALEEICTKLQQILQGELRSEDKTKVWGNWRDMLENAYNNAQLVLDEMMEKK